MKEQIQQLPQTQKKNPISSGGINDLMQMMNERKDPKEQLYLEMGQNLFDESKLMMIARLKGSEMEFILKNIIVIDFYQRYFNNCSATITLKPIKEYPYYEKILKEYKPDPNKVLDKVYDRFVNKIMKLTLSREGKSRGEIIQVLGAVKNQMEEKLKSITNMMG